MDYESSSSSCSCRSGEAGGSASSALRSRGEAGMEYASLGVDTEAPGAVFGLYSKLRFEPTRGSTMYTIEL